LNSNYAITRQSDARSIPIALFGPPYWIVTSSVVLRCFEPGDAAAVVF
jgi:hypothetical protein